MKERSAASMRSLRTLGVLSVLVPLFVYALFGLYRVMETREEADLRVSRSLRVAHEHASRVIGGAEAFQDRLFDLVDGKAPDELARNEAPLHALLSDKVRSEPQIQSIWIVGADGVPVATSLMLPAPRINLVDRAYFTHHQNAGGGRYLSEPFLTRLDKDKVMSLSIRFSRPDGSFGGVIVVSLLVNHFERFYADLVANEPGLAVNLFREGGSIYTRWPLLVSAPERLAPDSPVMASLAAGKASAQLQGVSSVDGQNRLLAYTRVGSYPLYVGTGMNLTAVRNQVLKDLGILLALGLPAFGAIFISARVAMRRTRDSLEAAQELQRETLTRRKAEEALLQAQKLEALGRLTGGVAHDFNNALMVISNNVYLLRRNLGEAGARQLDSITRAVDSATKITRQLLAFSRRQALVPERLVLQDKLPATRELITPVLGGSIELTVTVAPDTSAVMVDHAELELALLNLAINARDAMPSAGSFRIEAHNATGELPAPLQGDFVVIEASDTGHGIAADVIDKVFEPFFTTKPVGQGTGLGMSQIYGLCQRAGGTATVSSVEGQGTTVSLYLCAAPADAQAQAVTTTPLARQLGKSVLLVEDNDDVAGALVPLLEELGCKVTRLNRAAAACDWLTGQDTLPDIVLTDVVMPGELDGVALARLLRETMPGLPVLLMTGYAEQIDQIALLGFEVLPKPCTAEMLGTAIARLAR